MREVGTGPSSAATRRGTGPAAAAGAAKAAKPGAGAACETRAARATARAVIRRSPTACAESSSAHRSALYATAYCSGRRKGLTQAASWVVSRYRW